MSNRPRYPHVHQINVSNGGVPKRPVLKATVTEQGVGGDRQRNVKVHGGPDRAVCLFSLELIEQLQDEGHSIDSGLSGENLTLAGVEWSLIQPGVRVSVGPDVHLQIVSYTAPCGHNGQWFQDGDYQRISQKKNPGWSRVYARVLRGGMIRPGDEVVILESKERIAYSPSVRTAEDGIQLESKIQRISWSEMPLAISHKLVGGLT